MVLVLVGVHMAPNRVLTGSPGRELRGGADYRVGLVPDRPKCSKSFGDPAGSGRVFRTFSKMVRKGPGRPPDHYLGVRGSVIWGCLGSPPMDYLFWVIRFQSFVKGSRPGQC